MQRILLMAAFVLANVLTMSGAIRGDEESSGAADGLWAGHPRCS